MSESSVRSIERTSRRGMATSSFAVRSVSTCSFSSFTTPLRSRPSRMRTTSSWYSRATMAFGSSRFSRR